MLSQMQTGQRCNKVSVSYLMLLSRGGVLLLSLPSSMHTVNILLGSGSY